jgi:CheY-like chemotaxis protein
MDGALDLENRRFRILVADDEEDVLAAFRSALGVPKSESADIGNELNALSSRLFQLDASSDVPETSYDLVFCRQGEEAVEAVQRAVAESRPFSIA